MPPDASSGSNGVSSISDPALSLLKLPSPHTLPGRSFPGQRVGGAPSKLFSELAQRGLVLKNRVVVSPMCEYSSENGMPNSWHLVHLGALAVRGAGVVMTEATSVQANGRISPQDTGIWTDDHGKAWAPVAAFIKSQGSVPAMQLAHAGRKASSLSPFQSEGQRHHNTVASVEQGGWPDDVVAPSAIPYSDMSAKPREMSVQEIDQLVEDFAAAAKRADQAGFEIIEIHAAHGYLLHEFLSPLSNTRTDAYGGSLENRSLILLRTLRRLRDSSNPAWPTNKTIWVRLSCTDYMESSGKASLTLDETVAICKMIKKEGLAELIDCSGGGLHAEQKIAVGPGYQVPFAERIKRELATSPGPSDLLVGTVGMITESHQAESILSEGKADVVIVARELLRDAGMVLRWARELGVEVEWPVQYERSKPHVHVPKPAAAEGKS